MIERLSAAAGFDVPRETFARLEVYSELLRAESSRQNLVSASTLSSLWERHLLDSAQLVKFAPDRNSSWVDIGSGAGLPGIVIALLVEGPVLLVEPRKLRAGFLDHCVDSLCLRGRVSVEAAKVEKVTGTFDVITARAVANLDKLLGISTHLSTRKSLWVLPKGRTAQSELVEARRRWHCDVESSTSLTDPDSEILVLRNVKARGGR